jgi:glutamate dehydrogenase/leucine dehydrogenase
LGWIRDQTRFVNAASNDASEATARGVLAGIRACLAYRWAGAERPLTVLVQGLGRVGTRVVSGLVGANRHITGCDPVATAVSSTRQAHPGMEVIDPSHSDSHPCDLFVPCAVGPVVTASNVGQLPYQVICGSANTQLAHMDLAARLRGAGILYAPDFVVNAGAVIEGVLVQFEPGPDVRARVQARIDGIEGRCRTLFRDAESLGRAPAELAQEMVQS